MYITGNIHTLQAFSMYTNMDYNVNFFKLFVGYYMRTSHGMLSEDLESHTHWHAPYFFFATLAHTSFLRPAVLLSYSI
jgi:hypothetical protein